MTYSVTAPEIIVKQPDEKLQCRMDFTNLLATSETISSISSSSIVLRGGGASTVTLSDTSIVNSSKSIDFWVEGGSDNSRHRIEIKVVTSSGQILVGDGILAVRDT